MNIFNRTIKRIFDFVCSGIGLIILSPVLIIIAIMIKKGSDGPVFFKQIRVGKDGKNFEILKFRTMVVNAEKLGRQITVGNDNRITKVGGFLRKYKLDELPQLINILIGQMSIIGPRPVILEEYNLINEREKYGANHVKPGLTGWAQVNGRDMLDDETKARYDGEYVENFGFFMDLKCFFKTIFLVFSKDGIVEGSEASENDLEENTIGIKNISTK